MNNRSIKQGAGLLAAFILMTAIGCKKENSPANLAFHIGDHYQGGIIAYVIQPGEPGHEVSVPHGMIATPADQSLNAAWMPNAYIKTGATDKELGTGLSNTQLIIQLQGAGNYAASYCSGLALDNYHDWILPSVDELSRLYASKSLIGGFTATDYWTSSEYNLNGAWSENFTDGSVAAADKIKHKAVRAVRYF